MLIGQKLNRLNDNVFQVLKNSGDQSKPLEWKRSFNLIHIPLKDVFLRKILKTHENKISMREPEKIGSHITTDGKVDRTIHAVIDSDDFDDKIYCLVPEKEEDKIFLIQAPQDITKIRIFQTDELFKTDEYPNGVYPGTLSRFDFNGEDYFYFDIGIPKSQMDELVHAYESGLLKTFSIAVLLLSFTYEVDDAFREWHHSQKLLVTEETAALMHSINLTYERINDSSALKASNDLGLFDKLLRKKS